MLLVSSPSNPAAPPPTTTSPPRSETLSTGHSNIFHIPFHLRLIGNLESLVDLFLHFLCSSFSPLSVCCLLISVSSHYEKQSKLTPQQRNESVTCETKHGLYISSSACKREAERLEALLEQMTQDLCFIYYHKANLTLPFKCTGLQASHTHTHNLSPSSFLFFALSFLRTHTQSGGSTMYHKGCSLGTGGSALRLTAIT